MTSLVEDISIADKPRTAEVVLADASASINAYISGEHLSSIEEGDLVCVKNGFILEDHNHRISLRLTAFSSTTKLPRSETSFSPNLEHNVSNVYFSVLGI